eukprot:scaffold519_cov331-Pavlova_lutheri.AAC.45
MAGGKGGGKPGSFLSSTTNEPGGVPFEREVERRREEERRSQGGDGSTTKGGKENRSERRRVRTGIEPGSNGRETIGGGPAGNGARIRRQLSPRGRRTRRGRGSQDRKDIRCTRGRPGDACNAPPDAQGCTHAHNTGPRRRLERGWNARCPGERPAFPGVSQQRYTAREWKGNPPIRWTR